MKRRFAAILFLIFFGLFLAGCDGMTLPSGVTLPTTTSATEAPTSGGETTAIPTTAVPTSGGETTAVPTTAVPTTAVPTTAVPTTAVPTTAVPTTAVPTTAPVTTEPVTTETPTSNDYTTVTEPETVHVLFFDDQGTLLHETDVIYDGTAIYGGAAPTKVEDDDYSYTFVGWSLPLENLRHDTSVVAVFQATYKHGSETFDTETLYDVLRGFDPESEQTPDQLEEQAEMMMLIFGVHDEEHLYNRLQVLLPLVMAIEDVTTQAEFVTWYTNLKNAGLDEEMIVDGAIRLLAKLSDRMVEDADPAWMIAEYEASMNQLALSEGELASFMNRVQDYAINHTAVSADAIAYFNGLVAAYEQEQLFYQARRAFFDAYNDDYDLLDNFDELHYKRDMYFYYLYEVEDPISAQNYLDMYDSLFNSLPAEDKTIIQPLIDLYDAFRYAWSVTIPSLNEALAGDMDFGTLESPQEVAWVITHVYFGDYQNILSDIENYQDQIQWMSESIPERIRQFEFVNNLKIYLLSEEGMTQVKEALQAIFNTADTLMLNFDPDLFNLIMDVIAYYVEPEEPVVMMIEEEEEEEPKPSFLKTLTAADIAGYIQDVASMLQLADTTMDETQMGHITDLIKDVLTLYLEARDIPALAITGILAKVDEYVGHVEYTFGEVTEFLLAVDEIKVQKVLDFVAVMRDPEANPSQIDMILMGAGLADTLLGDGVLDVNGIVTRMISVYFDVSSDFNPNAAFVLQIQTAITGNITGILNQCEILNGKDAFSLGAQGLMALEELMARIQAFQRMFEEDLETILEPIETGFDHDTLMDFVRDMFGYSLTDQEVEALILDLMDIFGQETEVELYYLLFGGYIHIQSIQSIDSFTDLKAWVNGIESIGLTRPELAQTAVNLLIFQLTSMLAENGEFDQREASIQEYIVELQIDIAENTQSVVNLNQTASEAIAPYNTEQKTLLNNYWQAAKLYRDLEMTYDIISNSLSFQSEEDSDLLMDLLDAKWQAVTYEDPTAFDELYGGLTLEQVEIFDPVLVAYEAYLSQQLIYDELDGQVYAISELNGIYWNLLQWTNQYSSFKQTIYYREKSIESEQIHLSQLADEVTLATLYLAYLEIPENATRVQDVILIVLDEVDNLLNALDQEVMDELAGFVFDRFYFPYKSMVVEEEETTLTPEMVQAILAQLSLALDSLFATVDATDDLKITTLLKDVLEIQFTAKGVAEPELTATLERYGLAIDRYYPEIENILDLLKAAVDGLDLTEIATLMELLPAMGEGEGNDHFNVIYLTKVIRILTDHGTLSIAEAGTLDYPRLINLAVELMIDVRHDFEPVDESVLTTAQGNVMSHFEALLDKAYLIAQYDPMAMPEDGMGIIFEMQNYGEYFFQQLMDLGPEAIVYPFKDGDDDMFFGYQHQYFVDYLLGRYWYSLPEEQVEDMILSLVELYDGTEEATFFHFWMTEEVFNWAKYLNNFSEYLEWSEQLFTLGLPDEVVMDYLFGYLGLRQALDVEELWQWDEIDFYTTQIADFEELVAFNQGSLATIESEMDTLVGDVITNPAIKTDLLAFIDQGIALRQAWVEFQNALIRELEHPDDYQWYVYDEYYELSLLRFGDYKANREIFYDEVGFANFYMNLDLRAHGLYDPILELERAYVEAYLAYYAEFDRIRGLLIAEENGEESVIEDIEYNHFYEWDYAYQDMNWLIYEIGSLQALVQDMERDIAGPRVALEMLSDPTMVALLQAAFVTVDDRIWAFVDSLPEDDRQDIIWDINDDFYNLVNYLTEDSNPEFAASVINNIMMLMNPVLVDYATTGSDLNQLLDQYVELFAEYSLPEGALLGEWTMEVERTLFDFIDVCYAIDEIVDPAMMTEAELLLVTDFLTIVYPAFNDMFPDFMNE